MKFYVYLHVFSAFLFWHLLSGIVKHPHSLSILLLTLRPSTFPSCWTCFFCLILHPNVKSFLILCFRVIPFSHLRSQLVLETESNLDISNTVNFSRLIQTALLRVEISTLTQEYFSAPLPNNQVLLCIVLVLPNTVTYQSTPDYSDLFSVFFTHSALTPWN